MFWNKKEDEKPLPDLPPSQTPTTGFSLPNVPQLAPSSVPTFPETPHQMHEEREEFETISLKPVVETKVREMGETTGLPRQNQIPSAVKTKGEEVFVKLDKFQSARKALLTLQEQVQDIATTLKRVRETKVREEQELSSWEKEVSAAKAKVEEVNKTLFDKV
jgi:hypothetical protein